MAWLVLLELAVVAGTPRRSTMRPPSLGQFFNGSGLHSEPFNEQRRVGASRLGWLTVWLSEEEGVVSVYKVIELVGTSDQSWEEAAKSAVTLASQSRRDLRVAEVIEQDLDPGDG